MQALRHASWRTLCAALFAMLPLAAQAASAPPADSTTVTPKAARAQPKAYNVGGALAIREDAGYQFLSSNGPVRLDIGRIENESATTISGSVRAGLFISSDPTPSGTYYVIARSDLGTLQPGFFFGPLSHTVPYLVPPDGTYYIHMGAFEFEPGLCGTADGYCLDDWVTFVNRVEVIGGQIFDAGPPIPPTATAVEYYHTGFDHYFVTSIANEIALLDAGHFQDWVRTGATFPVWTTNSGSMAEMCRFFSTSFAPRSSHFYTATECATLLANPNWQFETIAFYVDLPSLNGNCVPGTQPLYRLYNDAMSGAPNHRYTISLDVRNQMLTQGWRSEGFGVFGTAACVPV